MLLWLSLMLVFGSFVRNSRILLSSQNTENWLLYDFLLDREIKVLLPRRGLGVNDLGLIQENDFFWNQHLPKLGPSSRPRYGGIDYEASRSDGRFGYTIRKNDRESYHNERKRFLLKLDEETDEKDLSESEPDRYAHYEEKDYPNESGCHRLAWSYEQNSACNTVHEQVTLDRIASQEQRYDVDFLGRGHFRMSFRFNATDLVDDAFVLKMFRLHERRNFNAFTFSQIQLEELGFVHTQASKLTTNLYARCGTSVVVESGQRVTYAIYPDEDNFDQAELDKYQEKDVRPYNHLTVEQKLKISLQMAEGIALLHGNKEGVIVNDDVQISQWLLGADGNLKLNDFNNAIVPKYNLASQEYCPFRVRYDYIFRSPQEIKRRKTDESGDVFAIGLIMYTILTGFMPFYERKDWDASLEALKDGEKPFIDPRYRNRSLIEGKLVEIMEPTWSYYIEDRANIFQVVQGLRDTVDEYEKLNPGIKIRDIDLSNLPLLDRKVADDKAREGSFSE
jgi:hypothetical protein